METGDHEIKIVNFAYDTKIFWGDINCFTRLKHILTLYEKASSSKINLSQALWVGTYGNRTDKLKDNMVLIFHYRNSYSWY